MEKPFQGVDANHKKCFEKAAESFADFPSLVIGMEGGGIQWHRSTKIDGRLFAWLDEKVQACITWPNDGEAVEQLGEGLRKDISFVKAVNVPFWRLTGLYPEARNFMTC